MEENKLPGEEGNTTPPEIPPKGGEEEVEEEKVSPPTSEQAIPPEAEVGKPEEAEVEEVITPPVAPLEEIEEVIEIKEEEPLICLEEGSRVEDPTTHITYQVKQILEFDRWRIPYNIYEVSEVEENESDAPESFWLWEAANPSLVEALKREGEILSKLDIPMFPKLYSRFENDGRFYLLTEAISGDFLSDIMDNLYFPQFLTIVTQLSFAIAKLHKAGWLHLGITPEAIVRGKPIKVLNLKWAIPRGEKVDKPFYIKGYSPPELLHIEEAPDERADVYYLGALIYRFLKKQPIPESGVEFPEMDIALPGIPQILNRCLTSKDERYPNMEALHKALLNLSRWYTPDLRYSLVGGTTIGLGVGRSTNQDAYGYLEGVKETDIGSSRWLVACVADGMGGMQAGEIASQIAVDSILSQASLALAKGGILSGEEQNHLMREWVNKANEEICDALRKRRARGGTTLLVCFLIDKRLAIAHIGDCRLYLLRKGQLTLLTRDHSLAATLAMQENKFDPEALRHHPDRSILTRSLGERLPLPQYFIDSLEQTTNKITLELQDGDILALCSDGIWEPIGAQEMGEIIEQNKYNLHGALRQILELTLKRGAPDNATLLLIKVEEIPPLGVNPK